ncbi:MAG: MBL fold metallo-hydrolase, partial [Candidatus Micrarchaeota archaeon]
MRLSYDSGIVVESESSDCRLILDPSRKQRSAENVLVGVSHAHSDHLKKHDAPVIATHGTCDLAGYGHLNAKKYSQKHDFDGMSVTQLNANHILGSSQFLIESKDGERIVYTGDVRKQSSQLFGTCEIPECGTLVVESTYGLPQFKFPSAGEVQAELDKWLREKAHLHRNVVLGAYSLGKSQEVIAMLNEIGITPVVHPRIAKFTDVYNEHGFSLNYLRAGTPEADEVSRSQFTAVMPHNLIDRPLLQSITHQNGRPA